METPVPPDPWPPYAFVPNGPWPHPTRSPEGHSAGRSAHRPAPIVEPAWDRSADYLRGVALFNAGYYWEAHEAWEGLWHTHGRAGPTAAVLKGLIKLAAAGVKVREGQPRGAATHARRAADLFEAVSSQAGRTRLGLDLDDLARVARDLADRPPFDPAPPGTRVSRVFAFRLEPRGE